MSASRAPGEATRDRLAALVVNYRSGRFAESCVASLMHAWHGSGRDPADLQVVVVDNASPTDESASLARIEAAGAKIVRSTENLGYARGMNRAYEEVEWPDDGAREYVAILNPDLVFLPDSVGQMIDYLAAHPDCGAVDPRANIDPGQVLHLPRNLMPTPRDAVLLNLAHRFGWAGRRYARRRVAYSLPWWESEAPYETDLLSGACVFLRREVVEEMGGPLDPRYPLYFEDTDLFRRLSAEGYRLVHLGSACVLHHWSRSAGVDTQFDGEPSRRYDESRRLYFQRFHAGLGARVAALFGRLGTKWAARGCAPIHPITELEPVFDPPTFAWDRPRRVLVELGLTPNFLIAAGALAEGDSWTCPQVAWEWLFQGRYYFRVLDRDTLEVLGAWRIDKTSPVRVEPLSIEEVQALGPVPVHG